MYLLCTFLYVPLRHRRKLLHTKLAKVFEKNLSLCKGKYFAQHTRNILRQLFVRKLYKSKRQ
jgi:hypothetical protein